jgi:tRNA A-37 threonylcarbamoyl transferase component Bud32
VSEFRQGAPILDRVRSRGVDAQVALASLSEITDVMLAAHGRGLVHGSVVAGNVLVRRGSTSLFLVDFGLAPLLAGLEDHASTAADDLAGLDVLNRALLDLCETIGPPAAL